MTTEEIHEKIQQCCNMSVEAASGSFLAIMEEMNNKIISLERQIKELNRKCRNTSRLID